MLRKVWILGRGVLAWVGTVTNEATLSSFLHILLAGKSHVFSQNIANGICHRCSGILNEYKIKLKILLSLFTLNKHDTKKVHS